MNIASTQQEVAKSLLEFQKGLNRKEAAAIGTEDKPIRRQPNPMCRRASQMIAKAGNINKLLEILKKTECKGDKDSYNEKRANFFLNLAIGKPEHNSNIINEGGISILRGLASCGTDLQNKYAIQALAVLAKNNPTHLEPKNVLANLRDFGTYKQRKIARQVLNTIEATIVNAGKLTHLIELLTIGTAPQKENAARDLRDLAYFNTGNKVAIVNAGAINPLIELLTSGTAPQKENAAKALRNLAANNQDINQAIINAGAIDPLVTLLTDGIGNQKVNAIWALTAFSNNLENRETIVKAGAIDPLVTLLRDGIGNQKVSAIWALEALAIDNPDNQKKIVNAGVIEHLKKLVKNGQDDEKIIAEVALWKIEGKESIFVSSTSLLGQEKA